MGAQPTARLSGAPLRHHPAVLPQHARGEQLYDFVVIMSEAASTSQELIERCKCQDLKEVFIYLARVT